MKNLMYVFITSLCILYHFIDDDKFNVSVGRLFFCTISMSERSFKDTKQFAFFSSYCKNLMNSCCWVLPSNFFFWQSIFDVESSVLGRHIPRFKTIIANQLKSVLRKRHTLPYYKLRSRPLTSPGPIVAAGTRLNGIDSEKRSSYDA